MKALSVRQPWAWLIVNGYKDIENRNWPTHLRGEVLVHASKGMTRDEYSDVEEMLRLSAAFSDMSIPLPAYEALERGGIVGKVTIIGCVTASRSPWFSGKFGFELRDSAPLPFASLKGALGFFEIPANNR